MSFLNVAFYSFFSIEAPQTLRLETRKILNEQFPQTRGTIIYSEEGVNAFLASTEQEIDSLLKWLEGRPELKEITGKLEVKRSYSATIPFTRMLVKVKKEIIPLGIDSIAPTKKTGKRIPPQELKKWYDEKKDFLILDTRNDYEIRVGTFENAIDLNLKHFRNFPKKLKTLPQEMKDKPIVMFCTGGIRCEKATAYALDEGFKDVYQLDGGILNYFEQCGDAHYQGECFVFDQRVALNGALEETQTVQCFNCRSPLTVSEQKDSSYIEGLHCSFCESKREADKSAPLI